MTPGHRKLFAASALFCTSAVVGIPLPVAAQAEAEPAALAETVVVYLVRHAEKADDGTPDPPLSVAGQIRVQTLRAILADASLTRVHSTNLERTRETARPIAEDAGVDVSFYEPGDLEAFAHEVQESGGIHLVSGHSNTTPALVSALGGDPHGPIDELEYDRLYILVITADGPVVTTLLRFGEPYVAGEDFGLRSSTPGTLVRVRGPGTPPPAGSPPPGRGPPPTG